MSKWSIYISILYITFVIVHPPAPCPPTQLRVNSSCESNNITVSWQASQGSVSYMAVAKDEQGSWRSCNTSSTTCQISGLLCGQRYQVYVAGVDENCIGAKSNVQVIHTGIFGLFIVTLNCILIVQIVISLSYSHRLLLQVSHYLPPSLKPL